MVAELIKNENQWDLDKLQQHFRVEDIEIIQKIPLPSQYSKDEVMWHFDKKGEYSTKSGYQLALKINCPKAPSSSNNSSKNWNALWALDLPEKVKIFMWKAALNIMPIAENLWKRKIIKEPICQRCRKGVETISHALFECKVSKKIWSHAPIPVIFQVQDVLTLISHHRKYDAEIMVAYCWTVWFARNKLLFEEKVTDPRISAAKAESVVEAYQRVRRAGILHLTQAKYQKQQKWIPPPRNVLKVNVDAAVSTKDGLAGLGAVMKDSFGKVVAAGVKQVQFKKEASFAEAEAMELGLRVAKDAAAQT